MESFSEAHQELKRLMKNSMNQQMKEKSPTQSPFHSNVSSSSTSPLLRSPSSTPLRNSRHYISIKREQPEEHKGSPLLPLDNPVIRVDENKDDQIRFEVSLLAKLHCEYQDYTNKLIAANKHFICYIVREKMIRILQIDGTARELLRDQHSDSVVNIEFFSYHENILASCGKDGAIFIYSLSFDSGSIVTHKIFGRNFQNPITGFAWNPINSSIFAFIEQARDGYNVNIWSTEGQVEMQKIHHTEEVFDISISPSGEQLAIANKSKINIWDLHKKELVTSWTAFENDEDICSAKFLKVPVMEALPLSSITMLMTGKRYNSQLKLWNADWECVQTVTFQEETQEPSSFHLAFDETFEFLFVGRYSLSAPCGFVLHLKHAKTLEDTKTCKFDYMTQFHVSQSCPILSLVVTNPNWESGNPSNEEMELFAFQTKATQLFKVKREQCYSEQVLFSQELQDGIEQQQEEKEEKSIEIQPEQIDRNHQIETPEIQEIQEEQMEYTQDQQERDQENLQKEQQPQTTEKEELIDINKQAQEKETIEDALSKLNISKGEQETEQVSSEEIDSELQTPDSLRQRTESSFHPPAQQRNIELEQAKQLHLEETNNIEKETTFYPKSEEEDSSISFQKEEPKYTILQRTKPDVPPQVISSMFSQALQNEEETQEKPPPHTETSNVSMSTIESLFEKQFSNLYTRLETERREREKLEHERQKELLKRISDTLKYNISTEMQRTIHNEIQNTVIPKLNQSLKQLLQSEVIKPLQDHLKKSMAQNIAPKLESIIKDSLNKTGVSKQMSSDTIVASIRQPMHDAFMQYFQNMLIPGFEKSCQAMFHQINAAFQTGIQESMKHRPEQKSDAVVDQLKSTVDALLKVTSSMNQVIVDTQNKILSEVLHKGKQQEVMIKPPTLSLPSGALTPQQVEVQQLLRQQNYEDAFSKTLTMRDINFLAWVCQQVDPKDIFSRIPLPMSQYVLLSLMQQLGYDLSKDSLLKLQWLKESLLVLNMKDNVIKEHAVAILTKLMHKLDHHYSQVKDRDGDLANNFKMVMLVVRSLLK